MKKLLSILLVSVLLIGCSTELKRYPIEDIILKNKLFYLENDMSLLNGVVNSEFGEVGRFIEGKSEGIHKYWYKNGLLELEENYKDGKYEGLYRGWCENGQLKYEGTYINGEVIGRKNY